jgi:hypothetical protein
MREVEDYATPGNEGSRTTSTRWARADPAAELHVA